jgi:hypothetical protein
MNNTQKQLVTELDKYFKDKYGNTYKKAQRAASSANWNIYFGPDSTAHGDKRYFAQLNRVKRFKDGISALWVDLDCGFVSDSEPQGYEDLVTGEYFEPYLDMTYELSPKEIAKLIFGTCADYI